MYLFFDTETTGIPRNYKAPVSDLNNWPRVVQLAYALTDEKGEIKSSTQCLIKPVGFEIPRDAQRIHGILTEKAMKDGIDLSIALDGFMKCFQSAKALVAHNMSYDENVLGAEFLRAKRPNPLPNAKRICTMHSTTEFCRIPGKYGFKWPTLSELH